jgi:anti-sigma factor RsiW
MTPPTVSDEDILRFMSDDLSPDEESALREAISRDPAAMEKLSAWTRQDLALSDLFDPVSREQVPQRLLDAVTPPAPDQPAKPSAAPVWLAAGIAILCLALGGIVGRATSVGGSSDAGLTAASPLRAFQESAVRAHETYVTEQNHVVEVTTEAPYLMTWLSNRLGHDIAAPDLRPFGFQLLGGRVLPAGKGNAAFLMYEGAGGQRVTLYVSPRPEGAPEEVSFTTDGPIRSMSWSDNALSYAVTGRLPEAIFRDVAESADRQL